MDFGSAGQLFYVLFYVENTPVGRAGLVPGQENARLRHPGAVLLEAEPGRSSVLL